ncbi:uncharacterized protein [Eleutherodactylus coqui]|uniref:uncharacterized protein isoform X2 n=1 Tax=Eleutherodactylus coqui TaxID=57060 RepID=UPI0034630D2E
MSFMENGPSSGHLKLEENVRSEDLINSKEGVSDHECFINQRILASGDVSAVKDQVSSADQLQELSCVPSEETRSVRLKETLNPVVDSVQYSDKIKEPSLRELCIGETESFLESGTIKWVTDGTVSSSELSQEEFHMDTVLSQMHDPCEKDLLNPTEHPMDQEECCTTNNGLYERIKGNDCQEQKNFKDSNMSASNIIPDKSTDLTMSVDLITDDTDTSITSRGSFDLYYHRDSQDCNETISPANKHAKHLQNSHYDNDTGTHKAASDAEPFDISANRSVSEGEKAMKVHSLDFHAKNSAVGFSRTNNSRNGKRKTVPPIPKCRKPGPHYETEMVSHKLEFVEEENLSEQEESSEDDNVDHTLPYTRDRLDHRKERHQYVSDQLDPDVLHLLEMHLRKQQLVEIKEEKEEELLDVHINKEKSRSESFKLLRNISPVLDMVLEEPELEHSGDTLDEDSQSPSDIDSDDSSDSCEVELDLMESLQHDLMSKSSKIDKHEIATILQTPSSDLSMRQNKGKQKAALCDDHDGKITFETTENKEPKALRAGTGDSRNLHMAEMENSVDENFTSGFNSESTAIENGHVLEARSEVYICDSWEELTEVSRPNTDAGPENDSVEEPHHSYHCSSIKSGNKDLNLDVNHKGTSDTVSYVTYTGASLTESREGAFTESESESVRIADTSKEQCPTLDGNLKPHDIIVPSLDGNMSLPPVSKSTDNFPKQTDNCIMEEVSSEHHDDVDKSLGGEDICETDLKEELKSVIEENSSEPPCSSAEMSTLHLDLEEKILSILEKAHAADCRSSHLQAGAELLWKESIELRNECKSLSKEAAELLSIFKKQTAVPRQPRRQSSHRTKTLGELLSTTDTKPSSKETLYFSSKNDSRNINKGEDQLQFLSKKYNFLREEAPEIMRELHVLQQDLKSLPSHHSKPMSILYSLLWGGLMTGGALLLVWWSTKQLG